MTYRSRILAVIALGALAGCGGGPRGPNAEQSQMYMNGLGGRGMMLRAGPDANAVYTEATALKAKGDCKGAVPKLTQVANLGPGYENAQTALGECLLQGAGGADLSSDYLEGLTWLRRAGDAGWPEAQGRLAYAHALGPTVIRNADEAGYWLALYQTNTGKSRVGFMPMPADQLAAAEAALPAASKAAGKARALNWQRKAWIPPAQPPSPGPEGKRSMRRDGGTPDTMSRP